MMRVDIYTETSIYWRVKFKDIIESQLQNWWWIAICQQMNMLLFLNGMCNLLPALKLTFHDIYEFILWI
jgi:hypothetical protein